MYLFILQVQAILKADQLELKQMFHAFQSQQPLKTEPTSPIRSSPAQLNQDNESFESPVKNIQANVPNTSSIKNLHGADAPYTPYPYDTHVMYKTHLFVNTGMIYKYDHHTCKYSMKTKDGALLQNLHRNNFTKLETPIDLNNKKLPVIGRRHEHSVLCRTRYTQ